EAGLLLILGVDTFLDMGRSATNAVGNSIASAVVAKWEGELMPEAEAEANAARLDAEAEARMNEAVRDTDRVTSA
ncbi:cation:dicarboxylase symporter family transporter, partial [Burkholderia contaminans]|nr:cation:dicarboxylase symporter family transporter [Burkholderia contaminans]